MVSLTIIRFIRARLGSITFPIKSINLMNLTHLKYLRIINLIRLIGHITAPEVPIRVARTSAGASLDHVYH